MGRVCLPLSFLDALKTASRPWPRRLHGQATSHATRSVHRPRVVTPPASGLGYPAPAMQFPADSCGVHLAAASHAFASIRQIADDVPDGNHASDAPGTPPPTPTGKVEDREVADLLLGRQQRRRPSVRQSTLTGRRLGSDPPAVEVTRKRRTTVLVLPRTGAVTASIDAIHQTCANRTRPQTRLPTSTAIALEQRVASHSAHHAESSAQATTLPATTYVSGQPS